MFNRGTAEARRLAVDEMIRALAAKIELDRRREEEARLEAERRRAEQARRRVRSLQRHIEPRPIHPVSLLRALFVSSAQFVAENGHF